MKVQFYDSVDNNLLKFAVIIYMRKEVNNLSDEYYKMR